MTTQAGHRVEVHTAVIRRTVFSGSENSRKSGKEYFVFEEIISIIGSCWPSFIVHGVVGF